MNVSILVQRTSVTNLLRCAISRVCRAQSLLFALGSDAELWATAVKMQGTKIFSIRAKTWGAKLLARRNVGEHEV